MVIGEQEAKARVAGGTTAVLDDATLERDWGWVFVVNSAEYARTRDHDRMLYGVGPAVVERAAGDVFWYPSSIPSVHAVAAHEQRREGWLAWASRRLRLRFRSRPARRGPRMPVSRDEADLVYGAWDRRNGRAFAVCDVALDDGALLRDVTFDTETWVAVEAQGRPVPFRAALWGRAIARHLVLAEGSTVHADAAERERFAGHVTR